MRAGAGLVAIAAAAAVSLAVSLVAPGASASGFAADGCPTPSVSVFDLALPAASNNATDNLTLASSATGLGKALFSDDASHTMVQYLDYSVIQNQQAGQPIRYGNNALDLAPAGPLQGVDYLVTGAITGTPGAYTVSVSLQDAYTRTVIASGSATFATAAAGAAAAEQAGDQLTPVFTKIRNYQQQLRDSGPDVALLAALKLTPAKQRLNVGESTPVRILLSDCDGTPLANRSIALKASGGTVSPATVTTAGDGTATVIFTARKRGPAKVKAYYMPYTTAVHQPNAAYGEALLDVDDPLTNIYVLKAQLNYAFQETAVMNSAASGGGVSATNGSANASADIVEWRNGNPLAAGSHLIASSSTGDYSRAVTMSQQTPIGLGYYCIGSSVEEFDAGQPAYGSIELARARHGYAVSASAEFKGTESDAGQANAWCPTPGATNTPLTTAFTAALQDSGHGWSGACSGSSSRITCDIKHVIAAQNTASASDSETEYGSVDISIHRLRASQTHG